MSQYYFWVSLRDKVYVVSSTKELEEQEANRLGALLDLESLEEVGSQKEPHPSPPLTGEGTVMLLGPRLGTTSPANSNLVAAYDAMSHTTWVVLGIEGYVVVDSQQSTDISYDVMTEGVYTLEEIIASHHEDIQFDTDPELLEQMEVDGVTYATFGTELLHALNKKHGLALTKDQIQYFVDLFLWPKYKRTATFSELHLFAQLNSEHCRHNIFNGRIIVDGEVYEKSMFRHIRDTHQTHPGDVVVAYSDNGAILKATDDRYIVIKAETHNHPCLIAPIPWGATGSGGCYRDILATGRGSMVEISTSTYCVGDVTKDTPYRTGHQTPAEILQKASYGVNDYGNCFAAPLINGSTLAVLHDLDIGWEVFSHAKPVVMAGSAGWTHVGKVDKQKDVGLVHIKLGWPDYAIGIWWAAASSMNSGENTSDLDFASVQRANPQMQIKVKKVLESIMTDCPDAIRNIHDYGAGGHGTNIFELYEGDDNYVWGGEVDVAQISVEDASMTYHQILINESQERIGMLIHPDYLEQISAICAREKCPFDVLGKATGSGKVRMYDSRTGQDIVHVAVEDFLLKDRTEYIDSKASLDIPPLDISKINEIDLLDVLKHPTVWSKGYIVHHVDRSVRGNIVQQQTVGRRQFPLADYGLFKTKPLDIRGTATAQWMRPYHSLISPAIMSQWSLAETILNLSFVKSKGLDALSLSWNRMRSAKTPSGKASLYEAVEALSIHSQELGINIPVGKDSMSMKVTTDDGADINAPGTLVLSWFVHVPDVTKKVTPELKDEESSLVWFPCFAMQNKPLPPTSSGTSPSQERPDSLQSALKWGLNGSVASWLGKQLGDSLPWVDMSDVKHLYNFVQELLDTNQLLAGHDISEGWLWTAIVEMYVSSEVDTLDLGLSDFYEVHRLQTTDYSSNEILLSEYPGVVLQVKGSSESILDNAKNTYGLEWYVLGNIDWWISIDDGWSEEERLNIAWGDTVVSGTMSWTKQKLINARSTYNTEVAMTDAETTFVLPEFGTTHIPLPMVISDATPKVMILRDEGTNGEHDMHTAFGLAGFETVDVTITDLQEKRTKVSEYQGLVLPGGFSYGDWPRSGKSFAEVVRHNPLLSEQFETFRESDNFVLWVCNGNQVLMELGWITDTYNVPVAPMEHNDTWLFESRYLGLRIEDADNRFFREMHGRTLPVWVAHGEWRYADTVTKNSNMRVPVRYVNTQGSPTEQYPYNPNGSLGWVAAILSQDGNILGMMPHPERTILAHQLARLPRDVDPETVTWLQMFRNLRGSV